MPYLVIPVSPRSRNVDVFDFLMDNVKLSDMAPATKFQHTETRTVYYDNISEDKKKDLHFKAIVEQLEWYAKEYRYLLKGSEEYKRFLESGRRFVHSTGGYELLENEELYNTFYIPKASSKPGNMKWRKIDAPCGQLETALRELKEYLEYLMGGCTYNTNAFAYIPGRSVKNAVQKHAYNKSKWFLKMDFSNFFGSITIDFVMRTLSDIFPFSEIVKIPGGYKALKECLELGFLDGGLPQGTPLSPLLTNIVMIGIDHKISTGLRERPEVSPKTGSKCRYVYTRYADDIYISNRVKFDYKQIMDFVKRVLDYYEAPFSLNEKKTRFSSNAGENWMLGLMYNQDCKVTVGHKRKKRLKAALTNYMLDRKNGIRWELGDIQQLQGEISYCSSIEKESTQKIIRDYSEKFGDIKAALREDLRKA